MRKHKAAISIFMIIITLASVTLSGVFIDLSRILVAKNRVRTATESAVRSTLAGYDEDLNDEWGLFGLNEENAETEYKKYLRLNLHNSNDEGKSSLINYEILDEGTNLTLEQPLSDKNVFSDKITEYSKYRAPVSLTLGVIDKFKAIFGGDNVLASIDVTSTIDELTGKMKNSFSNLSNISTNFNSQVDNAGVSVDEGNLKSGQLPEINTNGFDTMRESINTNIDTSKTTVEEYGNSLSEYKSAGETGSKQAENVRDSVSTEGVNGEISNGRDEVTADKTYGADATLAASDNMQQIIDNETTRLEKTQEQTGESAGKTEELKTKMEGLIADAENKAVEYNRLKNIFNQKYTSMSAKVAQIQCTDTAGKPTVDDVLKYDTEKKIKDSRKKVNDTLKKLTTIESEIVNAPSQEQVKEAANKAANMRNEYNIFSQKFPDGYDDTAAVINELNQKNNKNEYNYTNIKNYYSEYYNDSSNQSKSFTEFMTAYVKKIDEADKSAIDLSKKRSSAEKKISEKASLAAYINGKEFKTMEFAANNESTVLEAVKAKKAATDYYNNTYKPALNKIKEINTQSEIGSDQIQDFAGITLDEAGADDEDTFSIKELFDMQDKIRNELTELVRILPMNNPKGSDLPSEESKIIELYNKLKDYFNGLGELVTNSDKVLDKIYLVDYVMNKCSFLTSQTTRNHYFSRGEVEYIIFGQPSQVENIALAVGSIALMRFAINAINYWITTPGELITRTVTAITRGLVQTGQDMADMVFDTGNNNAKGLIAICPSLSQYKVLSYSDHLRILLLLKISDDGGTGALRRCIAATIESDGSGVLPSDFADTAPLNEYYTKISAKSSVDMDLFFIPLLLPDFINFGGIHNGKYTVSSSISFGY